MHQRRPNVQLPYAQHYRLLPQESIIEQKFQPVRPLARHVDLALAETGHFCGLASTMNSTASSANKSHKEFFQKPELRRINVLSKKPAAKRLYESGQSIASEPAKDYYQAPTDPEVHQQRPEFMAAEVQQLSQSHSHGWSRPQPPTESLEWESLRKRCPSISNSRRLTINCRVVEPKADLCECEQPCRWGSRWAQWTRINHRHNNLYRELLQYPVKPETQVQIDKDLRRTQPLNRSFQQQATLRMLRDVLTAYSVYDMQVDYVQGMNLIASVLLYHIKEPQKCFWVLVDLMERREFKEIYLQEFAKLRYLIGLLVRLVKYRINDLYEHFQLLGVELEHVAYGWFLSLMCNVVPLEAAHLVVDKFVCDGWTGFLSVAAAYLVYLKEELMMKTEATDILARFSSHNEEVEWEVVITASDNIVVEMQQLQSMRL